MYVKMKIEKEDGEPFDDTKTESGLPIDIIAHTIVSVVEVALIHIIVSTSGTNYMNKAVIEALLNYKR